MPLIVHCDPNSRAEKQKGFLTLLMLLLPNQYSIALPLLPLKGFYETLRLIKTLKWIISKREHGSGQKEQFS